MTVTLRSYRAVPAVADGVNLRTIIVALITVSVIMLHIIILTQFTI